MKNGKKEGGSTGKSPWASAAASHTSCPALPGTNSALVEISTTLFFFPLVDFGGTCGSLQQRPKLEADKISVKHICLCSEGMLQESAQAECGRGAALFPGMRQLLVQLQKKNQESPN